MRPRPSPHGSPIAAALLLIGFAVVHSFLASRPAKAFAARLVGRAARDGLYRPFYIAQAAAATAWAVARFVSLPDRELYRVPAPWSWLLRSVQLASLALLSSAIGTVRLHRILGLPEASAYLRGEPPGNVPEAQGPLADEFGQVDPRGPFRYIRHPDNLPIITLLWSFPRMTVNRLVVALLSSVYAILGSVHEDARLRAALGASFERYARSTPMMIPRLPSFRLLGDREP